MPTWVDLLPFLVLGAAGSLHCIGMCGVFAIAAAGAQPAAGRGHRIAAYITGKATTYAILGALGANAVTFATRTTHALGWHGLRATLAWAAGGVLVLTGLVLIVRRLRGTVGLPRPFHRVEDGARWLYRTLRELPGTSSALGTGLLTGLLPCGLSWSAILLASRFPAPAAAGAMIVFGLATGPALALTAVGWSSLPVRAREHAARFAGALCVLLGVLTIARGGLPEELAMLEHTLPDCCQSPDESTGEAAAEAHPAPPR
jgi:hypothetical protein